MKTACFFLLWLPICCAAQNMVLIDRNLKAPFQLTDSVALEDVAMGAYPLYACDIDTVVQRLDMMARQLSVQKIVQPMQDTVIGDNCVLFLWPHSEGAQVTYSSVLHVSVANMKVPFVIARDQNRKNTIRRMMQFADYLRNNRQLLAREASK